MKSAATFVCPKCGHELIGEEHFCGNCGSPRSSDYEAPNLQSKVASLWNMQQAMQKDPQVYPANGAAGHEQLSATLDEVKAEEPVTDCIEPRISEPVAFAENLPNEGTGSADLIEASGTTDFENAAPSDLEHPLQPIPEADVVAAEPTALVKSERGATWTSAATTLEFFQRLAAARNRGLWAEFWKTRRGDIYLAIAVVLMVGVIRWAIWSDRSVSATGNPTATATQHRTAPDADLSLFDRILIKLGVAEAPDPPQYKGNPRTQVWLDLQTALYYCPGADLYGKTPRGRFSSQREAQLDQFEPAYRKACD
jgi:zinc ribbon protein